LSRCVAKSMYLDLLKRPTIWNGGSIKESKECIIKQFRDGMDCWQYIAIGLFGRFG